MKLSLSTIRLTLWIIQELLDKGEVEKAKDKLREFRNDFNIFEKASGGEDEINKG